MVAAIQKPYRMNQLSEVVGMALKTEAAKNLAANLA